MSELLNIIGIVKTTLYHECPCCHSTEIDYGECDTRNDSKPNHEWYQHMTCKICKSKYISVFHHVHQEILEDNTFNTTQTLSRHLLIKRIKTNTLTEKDLQLFSDMLENAELIPDSGFQIGIYAIGE